MTVTRRICSRNAFVAGFYDSTSVVVHPEDHVPQMDADDNFTDAIIRIFLQAAALNSNAK